VPGRSCTKNHDSESFESLPPPIWMTGRSASCGNGRMRFMRPITSTRAAFMSVPIENVRLMKLPPEFALPSISSTPGSPCSTCSCGSRSCASASSGEAARQPVKIEMFGRSMSGKSCSGSLERLNAPNRQISATVTATAIGLRMDAAIRRIAALPRPSGIRTLAVRHRIRMRQES
jgi:hypothetical protein